MKKTLAVVATLVVLAGCSSAPVVTNVAEPVQIVRPATVAVAAPSGQSQIVVERMVRTQGCEPVTGASMTDHNGPVENYIVKCSSGQVLAAHCEYRNCQVSPASGSQIASAAPATPVAAPIVATQATVAPSTNVTPAIYVAPQAAPTQNAEQMQTAEPAQALNLTRSGYTAPWVTQPLHAMFSFGASFGGDTIPVGDIEYSDNSSVDLKAGQGVQFSIGLDYRISDQFAVQGSVGYEYDMANATNGNLRFNRYPVELLGFYYLTDTWRLGAGVRLVESPQLIATGVASGNGIEFNNATGSIFEIEHLIGQHMGVHFRVINESFTANGYTGKLSGNSAGIFITGYY